MYVVLTEARRGHWIPGSGVTAIVSCHVDSGNGICSQLLLSSASVGGALWMSHLPSISSSSFQGTDPISQTKVAELLGEGDGRRISQEGPGDSVKFEGGDDASVAVEWSGVSVLMADALPCHFLLALRSSEAVFLQVCTGD